MRRWRLCCYRADAGRPLRAKYIAETFWRTSSRCATCATCSVSPALYKGRRISVMGAAWAFRPCSIYAKRADRLRREDPDPWGSCGAVREDVKLRDVVIGMGATPTLKVNRLRFKGPRLRRHRRLRPGGQCRFRPPRTKGRPCAGQHLLRRSVLPRTLHVSDVAGKYGIRCRMEAAGIWRGRRYGAGAICVSTISRTGERTTSSVS